MAVLIPIGLALFRDGGLPFGGTDIVMLMTRVGEIRQVELADGSRVTLDTATKVVVEIGRSRRSAHLRYGRARFQVALADAPFVEGAVAAAVISAAGQPLEEVLRSAEEVRGASKL